MRMRSARLPLLLAFVTAALALFFSAPSFSAEPRVVVPFAVTTLLLAVLAMVVAAAYMRQPSERAVMAWRGAACEARTPARQCDPDAAGHVRSRAPGVSLDLFVR